MGKIEVLRIVSIVQLVRQLLLLNQCQIQHYLALLQQELMIRFITKSTPISYIDVSYMHGFQKLYISK